VSFVVWKYIFFAYSALLKHRCSVV